MEMSSSRLKKAWVDRGALEHRLELFVSVVRLGRPRSQLITAFSISSDPEFFSREFLDGDLASSKRLRALAICFELGDWLCRDWFVTKEDDCSWDLMA